LTYRILCAYDESSGAEKAFDFALELATLKQGELHVVAVFEPAEASRGVKSETLQQTARQHFSESLSILLTRAAAQNVVFDDTVALGNPSQQILKRAEELKADHIVVGRRGKGSRTAVGSVSLRVVTHGLGTVSVVR
jgi:nucleotide-binding universal stress UspA family protein